MNGRYLSPSHESGTLSNRPELTVWHEEPGIVSARPICSRGFFRRSRFNRLGAWRPAFSVAYFLCVSACRLVDD